MTVVLPAPVASFSASRANSGFASSFALSRCSRKRRPAIPSVGRDLDQPDRRLHRLDLAEEGADIVESMVTPVLQQARRLRRHPPLTRIRQCPPAIDGIADAVDGLRQLVLLAFSRDSVCFLVEVQRLLSAFALLRLGDRRDERHLAPPVENAVSGLAAVVKLPVLRGVLVWRVEDRAVEELLVRVHADLSPRSRASGAERPWAPAPAGYCRPKVHSRWSARLRLSRHRVFDLWLESDPAACKIPSILVPNRSMAHRKSQLRP